MEESLAIDLYGLSKVIGSLRIKLVWEEGQGQMSQEWVFRTIREEKVGEVLKLE